MTINFFEIFSVGFTLGLTGPCLFYCVPLIFAFTLGTGKEFKRSVIDILVFLSARSVAYIILALIAALSGVLLRKVIGPQPVFYFMPLAGVISIALGLAILLKKNSGESDCCLPSADIPSRSGLFGLGFIIGISPCVPLVFLLSEIALLSKSAWEGVSYGIAFGLGTFIPAFAITAALAGLSERIAPGLFRSQKVRSLLKIISSSVLILFGLNILAGFFKR
ncbi:MAG: sulfite exporter TauE/SafE family protein [Candidatus Omnitrophica bacterium]|nr:sulfite exporter TauE/SafE family protein [Candidatus Omnitrophota bacterium]